MVGAWLVLGAYGLAIVAIAVLCRKKSSTLQGFFLADSGVGGWMTAFSYGVTYFSSVAFIGYAGKFGMSMGMSSIFIGIGNAVIGALLAWLVLAKRTKNMSTVLKADTMPEFFAERYKSKPIKAISAIIIFIFLIPYSTSVYQGISLLFESVFGIPYQWCVVLMAVLTAAYLFSGGYFASAVSDFLQGIIMLVGIVIIIALVATSDTVNGATGFQTLIDKGYGFLPQTTSATGMFYDTPAFNLIVIILLTSFGIWAMPQSVHKFRVVKDNNAIKRAAVVSTLFCLIIGVGAYMNGGFARLFYPDALPAGGADSVVPGILKSAGFSKPMLAFVLVLVLSASMSTLSSLSLAGASAVALDFYRGFLAKEGEGERKTKLILRVGSVVFILVSAVLALNPLDAIVTLMSLSWGTLAGCFIGPYVLGLYNKKITKEAAYTSVIGGVVITVVLIFVFGATMGGGGNILQRGLARSPLVGVIAMLSSFALTLGVSYVQLLITKKPPEAAGFEAITVLTSETETVKEAE
ncbi:MAG: sodium:solute symporter family protein [Christensenellaceae bacterium]|jgi:SSS family solute:Na+ symporter|nr:sodium:solute symporter family protein [Christensenellaceae bacterium]